MMTDLFSRALKESKDGPLFAGDNIPYLGESKYWTFAQVVSHRGAVFAGSRKFSGAWNAARWSISHDGGDAYFNHYIEQGTKFVVAKRMPNAPDHICEEDYDDTGDGIAHVYMIAFNADGSATILRPSDTEVDPSACEEIFGKSLGEIRSLARY